MATFSLQLQRRVEPGVVASGKFDGSHACLAAATSGGNVLVHSPHRPVPAAAVQTGMEDLHHGQSQGADGRRLAWSGELAELQIGRQVTALCAGRLGEDERDVLLIGTHTHLLAYHVEDNADLFYKEMPDGAHAVVIGKLGWLTGQVAVIGGNCSVTVLDAAGVEIFWTVMGDLVISLAIFDFDGDGTNELLVGTKDFEIKAQKADSVLWEAKETAPVTALASLPGRQFAYAVGNGTIGVYEAGQRIWRVKSKHRVVSIKGFDINGDGIMELLTGWSSGKVDARTSANGEVIFRIQLTAGIAGIVEADYRRKGRGDLVVLSTTGEVRGYGSGIAADTPEPGEALRELLARRQTLQMELRHKASVPSGGGQTTSGIIGSKLAVDLCCTRGAVRLALAAGPGLLVHFAIVFAEGVFDGETLVAHPSRPKGELEIELRPPKDVPVDIHVKVCVGSLGADLLQVFELTRQLPRFCMYEMISGPKEVPEALKECGVTIEVAERPQRVALWLNQNLILAEELEVTEDAASGTIPGSVRLWLRGLRDEKIHSFEASASGRITLRTEDPTFAGDVVQSLAAYLGIRELGSEARFPLEEQRMTDALERVKGLKEVEARLQAATAGNAALLKNLIIRMEDARILNNVKNMRKRLMQLKTVNGDMIREHEIRMNSHKDISESLRELNIGVQRASRIRVGKAAANAVSRCRSAIQDGDAKALAVAIRQG